MGTPVRVVCLGLLLLGCASSSFADASEARAVGVSRDPTYGFAKNNPIKVGGTDLNEGPKRERAFLDSLRGPAGQRVTYRRAGSCCHFQTPNGFNGGGLLDMYSVTYEGLAAPVTLYINFYDPGRPLAPVGFTPAPE